MAQHNFFGNVPYFSDNTKNLIAKIHRTEFTELFQIQWQMKPLSKTKTLYNVTLQIHVIVIACQKAQINAYTAFLCDHIKAS